MMTEGKRRKQQTFNDISMVASLGKSGRKEVTSPGSINKA